MPRLSLFKGDRSTRFSLDPISILSPSSFKESKEFRSDRGKGSSPMETI